MFNFLDSSRIGVYLDYSNMHYTKYTLWWEYNLFDFLKACINDNHITRIALYGAYDPKNIAQFNRTKKIKQNFSHPKSYFFFKKLEIKGGKNKWNVDTEMGFDIAQDHELWDTLVLFSGDGDFLYPIQKLLQQEKTILVVSTKWHIAKELIDFINTQPDSKCRYLDLHKNNQITLPLKAILKDSSRSICLHSTLYQWIQNADNEAIKELKIWMELALHHQIWSHPIPKIVSENSFLKKILLHRQQEEKIAFITYLSELLE